MPERRRESDIGYSGRWTFVLVLVYFGIATLVSIRGCTKPVENESDEKLGFLEHLMQIIYQTSAGAVMLTDIVFWCLLLPFMLGESFQLTLLIGSMHSVNAVFLILESALNRMVSGSSVGSHPLLRIVCMAYKSKTQGLLNMVSQCIYEVSKEERNLGFARFLQLEMDACKMYFELDSKCTTIRSIFIRDDMLDHSLLKGIFLLYL
ncbi:uncharacterized protein LOC121744784 isoform X3 [Salvia splendens]|uniref:uncharacterized protein LOC121744784 isoform X3 n=1 Tax=Salvia splendens TaxID=180675 RepID=UPI001C25469E|nr:uncharacterized protein LOC121744784 isoform X3 [Salvia splendens]